MLGTSSQTPTAERNHNGYLVLFDGEGILVDPGEGTQRQLLRAGVAPSSITAVAITHDHGDHCLGLPGVLARLALDGLERVVPLVFPAGAAARVRALVDVAGPYAARVVEHPVSDDGARSVPVLTLPARGGPSGRDGLGGLVLEAAALDHRVPTCGYRVREPDGVTMDPALLAARGITGPDVGRLQRDGALTTPAGTVALEEVSVPRPGQRVALVMDTRPCEGASVLAERADLLVCEATFADTEAELAPRYGHMTARQAGHLGSAAGTRRLVLSHFSQRYRDLAAHGEQAREEHGDVVVAVDLMRVAVPPRR